MKANMLVTWVGRVAGIVVIIVATLAVLKLDRFLHVTKENLSAPKHSELINKYLSPQFTQSL